MLWPLTDEDREIMEIEKLDLENGDMPHDYYEFNENDDLAALEVANNLLDLDFNEKFNAAMSQQENVNAIGESDLPFWSAPSYPDGTYTSMIAVADKYFPSEEPLASSPPAPPATPPQALSGTVVADPDATDESDDSEASAKRVQPYAVAQELLEHTIIIISRNAIYFYDGRVYRLLTREDTQRLILDRCRDAVATTGSTAIIEGVYKCIFLEPRINVRDIDPSPNDVVFLDGVLNLNSMRLLPHSPSTYSTRLVQANYRKGISATCPIFDNFIRQVSNGDPDLERRFWQALGYLLVQDQRGKCFILLQGVRDSGKSVFGRFVQSLFDQEDISGLELHALDGNFSKSDLIGKSLWLDLDLPSGALKGRAASELKKITGGDLLSADIKYMPRASFVNRAKILFATNHPVLTDDVDEAFERRMIVIPFSRTIPQAEQDFDLDAKLQAEKDAVAAKAIQYFLDLRNNNYIFAGNFPANCAISSGEDLISRLFLFLKAYCEEADEWISTEELYSAFVSLFGSVCTKKFFSERFNLCAPQAYPNIARKRSRVDPQGNPLYGYYGIRLKKPPEAPMSNDQEKP